MPGQLAECLNVLLVKLPGTNRMDRESLKFFRDCGGNIVQHFPPEDEPEANRALKERISNLDMIEADERTGRWLAATSVGNLVRLYEPIVILDEGHKATSALARDTIEGFNPSMVVELTATPPEHANILCKVTGLELLNEEMIKLPINVANSRQATWKNCLTQAKEKRDSLASLAMQSYHGAYERFPSGYVSQSAVTDGDGTGPGWGWAAYLLPYLEQENLFRQIDFNKDILDPSHAAVRTTPLTMFRCPSDIPRGPTFNAVGDSGKTLGALAFANYVGMGGTFEVTGFPDTGNGVLFRNSRIKFGEVTDGASNTIFVIERHSARSPMTTWVGGVTDSINPPVNPAYDDEGPATLCLTNTGEAVDKRTPNNMLDHVEDASSRHSGVTCCLLGDGSVRSIPNAINPRVWEALGTRAGGETLGDY